MNIIVPPHSSAIDRMVQTVERLRERLLPITGVLTGSGIPHALVGGNAVAAWVSSADDAAVRNTRDVDILIRREDLDKARVAAEQMGFVFRHSAAMDMLLDGPDGRERDGVDLYFAGEKVREGESFANPEVVDSEDLGGFRVLSLCSLVRMKLDLFRLIDRVHLRNMIDVELIDESWCERYPTPLGDRLRHLIETPGG